MTQGDRNVSGSIRAKMPEDGVHQQTGSSKVGFLLGEDAVSRGCVSQLPKTHGKWLHAAVSPGICCGTTIAPVVWESGDTAAGIMLNSLPPFGICWTV